MRIILGLIMCCIIQVGYAQKAVKDNGNRAQLKRMVNQDKNDWSPKAKRILGVNVNPAYPTIWGWTAPMFGGSKSRNRKYKKSDIRPLTPQGKQTLRGVQYNLQVKESEEEWEEVKKIGEYEFQEQTAQLQIFGIEDIPWKWYFSKTLKYVLEFDITREMSQLSDEVRNYLTESGFAENYSNKMQNLKSRITVARKEAMLERGERIIYYHRIMDDMESEMFLWDQKVKTANIYFSHKSKNSIYDADYILKPNTNGWENRDKEITRKIINKARQ